MRVCRLSITNADGNNIDERLRWRGLEGDDMRYGMKKKGHVDAANIYEAGGMPT
jgi:hypothetical protein